MKKILFILLTFSLLISCSTTRKTATNRQQELSENMDSWLDSSKHDLLLTWGSPTSVSSDGNGGEILTFEQLKRAYFPDFGYMTVVNRYMFYINSQNIVYNWRVDQQKRQGQ
ncbi:hypothetical protein [Dysgonomonas sp. GY617]|uniref:hypothetical protein n=1 Tax=Dysgonomonas sp. GY617 TaxID=2780420 RepID=UPI0018835D77|nr:hypothetical protein [Dysgonomonas sp. GY617]MBF0576388.1 hypothetical protein [Dysgonomonas sp. GY617]